MANKCRGYSNMRAEDVEEVYNNFHLGDIIASTIVVNKNGYLDLFLFYKPKAIETTQIGVLGVKVDKSPKPSEKQKSCPKCGRFIPATWKFHQECGWNMQKEGGMNGD